MTHKLKGIMETREVWLDGQKLSPSYSLQIRNHSPDGFCWGYGGSGPAQLALAVLLALYDKDFACANYQIFKWKFIALLPQSDFDVEFDPDFILKKNNDA